MSLTLNDEQEAALRAWWASVPRTGAIVYGKTHEEAEILATTIGPTIRLSAAIAPLMQPWVMEPHELGWLIGNGQAEVFVSPRAAGHLDRLAFAECILRLLNESEARP